ncbi:hypothetical protein [Limnohabitans sp.]|uniref:hypothetical protein n=1 Tax=Limnohabitans sp. TaxID=1907725 RepID=UPI0025C38E80|nr:hypothetical protein [Limnohabitans sp.]
MARPLPVSYEELLNETLPMLDEHFIRQSSPVHSRPFEAARFIVDHMIVEITGDSKDDYLSKPWFSGIYLPVIRWYEQRYGAEIAHPKNPMVHGLVSHFGALYALRVELVLSEVDCEGHRWIKFPKEVQLDENPYNWLFAPPRLEDLKPSRRTSLLETSRGVANRLRSINNGLRSATYPNEVNRRMASTILRHLEKAALDATSRNDESSTFVPWELQMACEKAIKTYLSQRKITYPATHDLRTLNKLAEPSHSWQGASKLLAAFPLEPRVMRWRYAEITPPTQAELWRMYGAAVELIEGYADRLTKTFTFNSFAVKLKTAPWHLPGDA